MESLGHCTGSLLVSDFDRLVLPKLLNPTIIKNRYAATVTYATDAIEYLVPTVSAMLT